MAPKTLTYDGAGHRVTKTMPSGQTVYVYDAFDQLAAEYSTVVPSVQPCTTCYLSMDHLGSTRLVTDANANVVTRHDFLPFGEELPPGYAGRNGQWAPGGDNVDQKFTGQIRDQATGLDYFNARYFGAALGRFTSPDPANAGADPMNPQSWNAYAYVGNNPLNANDPTGLDPIPVPCPDCIVNVPGTPDPIDLESTCWWCFTYGIPFDGNPQPVQPQQSTQEPPLPTQPLPPPKSGKSCTVGSATAGQYATAATQVAGMTASFFSGIGPSQYTFGPGSAVSQVMAQSTQVQNVLNQYSSSGTTSNWQDFGAPGYRQAGANPVAQFLGSFGWSIASTTGGVNLTISNVTSFHSLMLDHGPAYERFPMTVGTTVMTSPMGNVRQTIVIKAVCP